MKAVFLLAILVSVVYGGHHILIWRHLNNLGSDYHPILVNGDEAMLDAPKAQAVYLGKLIVGDFNAFEYKDRRIYVFPPLSPLMLGALARVTGSIERAVIAGDFIFPAAIFIIFYFIIFEITSQKLLALVGSAFYVFIPKLAAFFPPLIKYLQAAIITMVLKTPGLDFSRIENPQLTVPIYLLFFYFAMRSITRNDKFSPFLAAFFYGLMFYSYFFHWTYVSTGLALLVAIYFFKKDWAGFRKAIIIFFGGLLLSIPHWINALNLSSLPQFDDIFARQGTEIGRVLNLEFLPLYTYFLHGALILLLFLFFKKSRPKLSYFLISFLLPIYIAYNAQLITGFNIQPDHWTRPTFPILYMAMIALLWWSFKRWPFVFDGKYFFAAGAAIFTFLIFKAATTLVFTVKFSSLLMAAFILFTALAVYLNRKYKPESPALAWNIIGVILIASIFAKGVYAQHLFIKEYKNVTISASETDAYRWLSENTPKYSVVGSPSFTTMSRVQLYTHNKIFVPNGYNTLASDNEIWERFFTINKIFGVTPETFINYLTADAGGFNKSKLAESSEPYPFFKPDLDQSAVYYLFTFRFFDKRPGSYFVSDAPLQFPKTVIQNKLIEYSSFISGDLSSPPYKLDYLYFGPREKKLGLDPRELFGGQLEKVYQSETITIYKIIYQ